jgi:adenylate kinase
MILLGAPGIGKGTQAELLCKRFHTCHLSTGDVFRAAKCAEGKLSPAMQDALGYMQRGELVPDETVIEMVRERLTCLRCDYGFLLDGFPRTVPQAEALEAMFKTTGLSLDAVLSFELPIQDVVDRLSGRRTCRSCKTTFHVRTMPPKVEGVCDKCGGELYQREDDRPESIRVRLEAYEASTAPLKDYYAQRGLLFTISAAGSPQEVFDRTIVSLRERSLV